MIFMRQIAADVKAGVIGKRVFYIAVCFLSIGVTLLFMAESSRLTVNGKIGGMISCGDAICYLFRGMKEYDPSMRVSFEIADACLRWNVFLAFLIGAYPADSLKTTGKNIIVRSGSRRQWWLSKCVWCAAAVLVFYFSIYVGIVIGTFLAQLFLENVTWHSLAVNPQLFQRLFETQMQEGSQSFLLAKAVVLPVLASLAISGVQMLVTFVVNGAAGYMAVLALCGFSAYYMRWFLPGNAMMLYRYCEVNPDGIGIVLSSAACGVYFGICVLAGALWFEKKDIY